MTERRTVALGRVRAVEGGDDGRSIEGVAVPYGERYQAAPGVWETIEPGAFREDVERWNARDDGARMAILDRHDGEVIGTVATLEDRPEGVWFRGRALDDEPAADRYLRRLGAGVNGASVEYVADQVRNVRDGYRVLRGRLHGIAGAHAPAFDGARLAVREQGGRPAVDTTGRSGPMPTFVETLEGRDAQLADRRRALGAIIEAEGRPYTDDELVELRELDVSRTRLATTITDARETAARRAAEATGTTDAASAMTDPYRELRAFRGLGAYTLAAVDDVTLARALHRALVDQITTNNPGVTPPTYLQTVVGILTASRPAIAALGGSRSLGDSGLSLHWPYYDGDLDTLVDLQATEKADIHSVRVDLKDGSAPINTYAGGSDISYQLLRRSSPSYQESYSRIMLAGYARRTEKAFEQQLDASDTAGPALDIATADGVRAWLFGASAQVEDATGAPATVVLAAPDVWLAIGSLAGLFPSQYGVQNVAGTADAASLRISVSGLPIVRARFLTAGKAIATNESAAGWHEDGPMVATAEDVAKLGRNEAYWGMAATAVYLPAGIVGSVATGGTTLAASKSSSKAA